MRNCVVMALVRHEQMGLVRLLSGSGSAALQDISLVPDAQAKAPRPSEGSPACSRQG